MQRVIRAGGGATQAPDVRQSGYAARNYNRVRGNGEELTRRHKRLSKHTQRRKRTRQSLDAAEAYPSDELPASTLRHRKLRRIINTGSQQSRRAADVDEYKSVRAATMAMKENRRHSLIGVVKK